MSKGGEELPEMGIQRHFPQWDKTSGVRARFLSPPPLRLRLPPLQRFSHGNGSSRRFEGILFSPFF